MAATTMNNNAAAINFSDIVNAAAQEMKDKIHSEEEAQQKLISISAIMHNFADLMKTVTGADKLTERLVTKMSLATELSIEDMANDFMEVYQRYIRHLTDDQQMKLRVLSGCKEDASVPTMVLRMVVDLEKGIIGFFKRRYNKIPKGIVLKTIEEVFGLGRTIVATIHYGAIKTACIAAALVTKAAAAIWRKVKGVWAWFKSHAPLANKCQENEDFDDIDFDIDEAQTMPAQAIVTPLVATEVVTPDYFM